LEYLRSHPTDTSVDADKPPSILGLLAYDSPYFGLSSPFISRTAYSHASNWGSTFTSTATLLSSALPAAKILAGHRWKIAGSVGLLATTLAGAAYMNRDKMKESVRWVSEHLVFAGALMNDGELGER
jgi:hypothetical protein